MVDDRVRRLLLEADIAALEGRGDSALARLVREDPEIRAVASELTLLMRETDSAMAEAAGHRARNRGGAATTAAGDRPIRPWIVRRAGPALATLGVAAAAVATLVFVRPDRASPPEPRAIDAPLTSSLEVSSSRPFAVFPTDNPDIAIVWLLNEEER
jgi:hypothetical protein